MPRSKSRSPAGRRTERDRHKIRRDHQGALIAVHARRIDGPDKITHGRKKDGVFSWKRATASDPIVIVEGPMTTKTGCIDTSSQPWFPRSFIFLRSAWGAFAGRFDQLGKRASKYAFSMFVSAQRIAV
jgi:hypothetical protein